jgi:hypothetical protein
MLPLHSRFPVGFSSHRNEYLPLSAHFLFFPAIRVGVAIYFYSPLWTFQVTTLVTLDDLPPVLLDFRDNTQPLDINGPETVQSSVVWSQTGLENTQHTLLVSVGPGQTLAVLDTLVYVLLSASSVENLKFSLGTRS